MDIPSHIRKQTLSIGLALSSIMGSTPTKAEPFATDTVSHSEQKSADKHSKDKKSILEYPVTNDQLIKVIEITYNGLGVSNEVSLRPLKVGDSSLTPQESKYLKMVERAASIHGVDIPDVILVKDKKGDLFLHSVGNRKAITLSTELLDKIDEPEVEKELLALTRHEMTHVKSKNGGNSLNIMLVPESELDAAIDDKAVATFYKKQQQKLNAILPGLIQKSGEFEPSVVSNKMQVEEELLADRNTCMPAELKAGLQRVIKMSGVSAELQEMLAVSGQDPHPITATRLAHLDYQVKHPPKVCKSQNHR